MLLELTPVGRFVSTAIGGSLICTSRLMSGLGPVRLSYRIATGITSYYSAVADFGLVTNDLTNTALIYGSAACSVCTIVQ